MYYPEQTFLVAGLSRSGIAAAELLLSKGAKVYLYDDVEEGTVLSACKQLEEKGAVTVPPDRLDEYGRRCDVLVLSPGIPVDHALPVSFRRAGKRVIGEAELGVLNLACPMVAVTGTNGKTTTVSMIESILQEGGLSALACGNIGKPICSCVGQLGEGGIAVAEISSFQLETLYSIRPHVAVVLNITEDHLNRHYNMDNYVYLKSRLLKNLYESEYAVLNYDDVRTRQFAEKTKAKVVWFSLREQVDGAYIKDGSLMYRDEAVAKRDELPFEGRHNEANALAAICAAKLMGVSNEAIRSALKHFKGVAHRQQKIGEVGGVSFVDDSKATNVDSTLNAIAGRKEKTVLLLGGKDKGYSYEPLFEAIPDSSVRHVVIYGENAFRILNAAVRKGYTSLTLCQGFETAVRISFMIAKEGECILLSPASASFDEFSGYEERGNRFAEIMREIAAECELKKSAARRDVGQEPSPDVRAIAESAAEAERWGEREEIS